MVEHRTPQRYRAILIAATAAGLTSAMVFGHATNTTAANALVQLTNTVIGAGGQGDPTGARVPAKLRNTVVPTGYDYAPVDYPATVALASSRDLGVPVMRDLLTTNANEDFVIIAGYSEGTLVAEKVRGGLQALDPEVAPTASELTFVFIAAPFAPNGGIYGRFPGLTIPGVIDAFGPATPTRYGTTHIAMMYDPYADFPAYFNPLALANSALGVRYSHPDEFYDVVQPGITPAYVTTVPVNAAGGSDSYVLVYNPRLPLLGPLRELSKLTFSSPLTEPVLGAFEPLLRVLVDMSYTDRVNANAAAPTPFSLVTPPAKFIEALAAVPGALGQGATNLLSGRSASTVPPPASNLTTVPVLDAPAPVPTPLARQARLGPVPSEEPEPTPTKTVPTAAPSPAPTAADSDESTSDETPSPAGGITDTDTSATTRDTTPGGSPAAGDPTPSKPESRADAAA